MSTALYRRYRPETFAEVIGQEHVTGPLMQALRTGRVTHAYLFSGPRGCGKTTSARILARTLNCARNTPEHPIDTPCGQCESCVELARGGSGSLDVVEIDAASHNGVDDARELRERAAFAPARDRYKIFILDEAHMVTPQGFNALLKLVEEPPEHVKFVFATTEPDKVIGTIRSRTHHYPFRLVPPDVLGPYLEELCAAEGVSIGAGVVPLVTRAGGGSVRDSLSVMDQLMAGADSGLVDYERAVALLGYTHATLLDDVVDAVAARDGASIFRVIDHVIANGHEPRRFVEDVLERLRDLIVIAVSGDAAGAVLRDVPADQLDRMRVQAANLGLAELSRAADLVNAALTEMSGATSPRLHLELLCARLLLPGADDGAAGFAARLDRLERGGIAAGGVGARTADAGSGAASGGLTGANAARAAIQASKAEAAVRGPEAPEAGAAVSTAAVAAGPAAGAGPVGEARPEEARDGSATPGAAEGRGEPATGEGAAASPAVAEPTAEASAASPSAPKAVHPSAASPSATAREAAVESAGGPEPGDDRADDGRGAATQVAGSPGTGRGLEPGPEPEAAADITRPGGSPTTGPTGALTTEELRRRWPEVLETLRVSRATWSLVSANAQIAELTTDVLFLGFPSAGLARTFSSPRHTGAVQDAVYQTLGLQLRVEARLQEGPGDSGGPPPGPDPDPASPGPDEDAGRFAPGAADPGTYPQAGDDEASGTAGALRALEAVGPSPAHPATRPAQTAPAAAPTGPKAATRSGRAAPAEQDPVVDAADEAWLAGLPAPEPPTDLEDGGDTDHAGETPRQAAERREAERRERARRAQDPATVVDPYGEPFADDPVIDSTGLTGVPLVVQMLGGTIIEEIVDHP